MPSYRPYNLFGKKDLIELLCMLCNLCSVSVKKVEKRVSWLLVSVEMAPSEIVVEDNSLVWRSKNKKKNRCGSQAMITSGPVLRPPPTPQLPHPHPHSPFTPRRHQYRHTDASMQANTHAHTQTHAETHNHTHLLARSAAEKRDAI